MSERGSVVEPIGDQFGTLRFGPDGMTGRFERFDARANWHLEQKQLLDTKLQYCRSLKGRVQSQRKALEKDVVEENRACWQLHGKCHLGGALGSLTGTLHPGVTYYP